MEFTAAGSCATSGVFKVEAGTIRLANGSSGQYGPCILLGDAAIDCAGGTVAFEDSADFAWTEGATLDIAKPLPKRAIRFGASANALTDAQLAQMTYSGKPGKLSLDADGYLCPPGTGTVILLR